MADRDDRKGRDAAGVGPYAREREQLVPMSTLESWTVSEGEPDIRGWEVCTVAGRQLGSVSDLLVDAKAGEVVMLDIDLPGTDRHTFVPIRVVHIDRDKRVVLMDSADLPDAGVEFAVPISEVGPSAANPDSARSGRGDREVAVNRPPRASDDAVVRDSAPGPDGMSADSGVSASDRRRAERRRIERMSTEF
jgi:sporulation protein YlmC with PRC-barrel domain